MPLFLIFVGPPLDDVFCGQGFLEDLPMGILGLVYIADNSTALPTGLDLAMLLRCAMQPGVTRFSSARDDWFILQHSKFVFYAGHQINEIAAPEDAVLASHPSLFVGNLCLCHITSKPLSQLTCYACSRLVQVGGGEEAKEEGKRMSAVCLWRSALIFAASWAHISRKECCRTRPLALIN